MYFEPFQFFYLFIFFQSNLRKFEMIDRKQDRTLSVARTAHMIPIRSWNHSGPETRQRLNTPHGFLAFGFCPVKRFLRTQTYISAILHKKGRNLTLLLEIYFCVCVHDYVRAHAKATLCAGVGQWQSFAFQTDQWFKAGLESAALHMHTHTPKHYCRSRY